jgi:hypothetical protein
LIKREEGLSFYIIFDKDKVKETAIVIAQKLLMKGIRQREKKNE